VESPGRRWFRFSLRTLFVVVTIVACWLGWNVNIVHQRRAMRSMIERRRGEVHVAHPTDWDEIRRLERQLLHYPSPVYPDVQVPRLRAFLGDEPIEWIIVRTEAEVAEARALFPEAQAVFCEAVTHSTHSLRTIP
jgi:hypothetical protein